MRLHWFAFCLALFVAVAAAEAQPTPEPKSPDKSACVERCEFERSKCKSKVRDFDPDFEVGRRACLDDFKRCMSSCGATP